jgi:hypothetical protein
MERLIEGRGLMRDLLAACDLAMLLAEVVFVIDGDGLMALLLLAYPVFAQRRYLLPSLHSTPIRFKI